jgi:hypothetical protein
MGHGYRDDERAMQEQLTVLKRERDELIRELQSVLAPLRRRGWMTREGARRWLRRTALATVAVLIVTTVLIWPLSTIRRSAMEAYASLERQRKVFTKRRDDATAVSMRLEQERRRLLDIGDVEGLRLPPLAFLAHLEPTNKKDARQILKLFECWYNKTADSERHLVVYCVPEER